MRILIAISVVLLCALLGSVAFVYSGIYSVAATDPHWPLTYRILETMRIQSIKAHADGIKVPPELDNPDKLPMGVEHFSAHCAVCHGGPGVPKGDIGKGLYPEPPDLAHTATHLSDAEMFWVIKNGIKMTGMPSWADHSDEEIWATVAFLKKLPGMTSEEYGKLIMATIGQGRHSHSGTEQSSPPADKQPSADRDEHRH